MIVDRIATDVVASAVFSLAPGLIASEGGAAPTDDCTRAASNANETRR